MLGLEAKARQFAIALLVLFLAQFFFFFFQFFDFFDSHSGQEFGHIVFGIEILKHKSEETETKKEKQERSSQSLPTVAHFHRAPETNPQGLLHKTSRNRFFQRYPEELSLLQGSRAMLEQKKK